MATNFTANSKSILTKGFGFIILVIAIMAVIWFRLMSEHQVKIEKILEEQAESRAIFTLRDAAYQRALILHRMSLLDDEFERDEEYLQFKKKAEDFIKAREIFLDSMKGGEFQKELAIWEQALPFIRKGAQVQATAVEHLLNDEMKAANELLLNDVVPTQNQVMEKLTELLQEQRRVTETNVKDILDQTKSGVVIMTLLALWAIAWSIGIGFYTVKRTTRIEHSLQKARKEAQDADKYKSQFLANMSHEIRTPLTAIIGYSETLMEEEKNISDWKQYVSSITRNGKHLHQLINDILDISKIEANQLSIEIIPVSLSELITEIESLMGERARKKGLEFLLDYHFPLPANVYTDPTRLKQILINLCGNAIKFTAEGHIKLSVTYDTDNKQLDFTVEDTGIGMTEEQTAELFKPFKQADASTTRKFGGTGLGLYISKQLSERLGGNLSLESQPGIGSKFTTTVKADIDNNAQWINSEEEAQSFTKKSQASTSIPTLQGKILLAEDNIDNQALISMHIKKTGAEVKIVENGQQAIDAALAEHFDLILMDMQMPVMGGIEAIKTLREKQYTLPIATLTANAMKEDIEESKEAGADDFLTKPIFRKLFYSTLEKYLPQASESEKPARKAAASSDLDDLEDLIDIYVSQLPETCFRINRYVNAREWEEVKDEIHQLKGTGGAFGFPEITEQCIDIEKQLKTKTYETAQQLITRLGETCASIAEQRATS
jgi:signal transduction histidine kinase/FixJ family two-component response regulator